MAKRSVKNTGKFVEIPTSLKKTTLKLFVYSNPKASATLILMPGGIGKVGILNKSGWPNNTNFLTRSASLFAAQNFNIILMGLQSNIEYIRRPHLSKLSPYSDTYVFHRGPQHLDNMKRTIFFARKQFNLPTWLAGNCLSSVSAVDAALALRDDKTLNGLILTSSPTNTQDIHTCVVTHDLPSIKIPVLVVHHIKDACPICDPSKAKKIIERLTSSPRKELIMVDYECAPIGNPCRARHYHGFLGMEAKVVSQISDWIRSTPLY